jgi:hypothetical protein
MIRKSSAGYTVYARTGRKMGTYRTKDEAQVRLGQLEAFQENRSPGQMSPTVRPKEGGYYVRAKSGRSMGWYPTKAAALRRKGQLEAQGAKHFAQGSPWKRSVPNRADLIAALGLEPEGRTRGQKYAFTTTEFWKKIRMHHSEAARNARRVFGLPEPGAHSWPGQPRRHAKAAKKGHRHHARRYSHSPLSYLKRFTRAELIAALDLDPEGKSRMQKYNFTTDEFRRKIATSPVPAAVEARRRLGIG